MMTEFNFQHEPQQVLSVVGLTGLIIVVVVWRDWAAVFANLLSRYGGPSRAPRFPQTRVLILDRMTPSLSPFLNHIFIQHEGRAHRRKQLVQQQSSPIASPPS
jgi:hypothetical protein